MSPSRILRALLAVTWILLPLSGRGGEPSDLVHRYVSLALQGDLTSVPGLFASVSRELTPEEARLRDQWRARFVDRTEREPLPDVPPLVGEVIGAYRTYWIRALTGELGEEDGEAFLSRTLQRLLVDHHVASDPPQDEAMDLMKAELEKRGFHLITGVTRPWFELMLWADQDTLQYEVELTDGVQPVTVVMMSSFLVRGWADFATFGRASTGGWATSDALFCLSDDYDRDSEKFTVSYLKHEGRHFADYGKFPELQQADLEYRGKLTELIYARDTFRDLVRTFRGSGAPNPQAPHAFANWAVIRDLGREVYGEDAGADDPRWDSLDMDRAKQAARKLLEANTAKLVAAGADTTRGVVVDYSVNPR